MHSWALVFFLLWQPGPLIAVFLSLRHSEYVSNSLFLFSVISFAMTGTLGDVIYRRHVDLIAADISSRNLAAEERDDLARRRGGVSWFGGLLGRRHSRHRNGHLLRWHWEHSGTSVLTR
jgi:hypothetical protein